MHVNYTPDLGIGGSTSQYWYMQTWYKLCTVTPTLAAHSGIQ